MDSQHFHAQLACSRDCFCHRVRDVVQLEIEKNFATRRTDRAHDFGTGRGVKLQADFENRNRARKIAHHFQGLPRAWKIEREYDAILRVPGLAPLVHAVIFRPVSSHDAIELRAPAKINLSFQILGSRTDGYHEIETLMAPISLYDEIAITKSEGPGEIDLVCDDPTLPSDGDNLAFHAARLFLQDDHLQSDVRVELKKKIPHGAGLGGGSSDAASVLLGLDELFRAGMSERQLSELASHIGSDVPFFIYQSAARCCGRGEIVRPNELPASLDLLLLKPSFGVSTSWAYKSWKESKELPGILYRPQEFAGFSFVNDLERPVFEKYVFLARLKMWLLEQAEVGAAILSGSGSTVFAALQDGADAEALAARAKAELDPELWSCACETL